MNIVKIIKSVILITVTIIATGFSRPDTIKIGTMAGPETELAEVAKDIAKKKYNINLEIVQFTDYLQPNAALADSSIDLNMFQHQPFLDQQVSTRGYHIVALAKTFIFPMGIYSKKHKDLNSFPKGAKVAIPNDPTNEGRALLLLQSAGLIKLKNGVNYTATPKDIQENPHDLHFIELEAPQLPRTLLDVDFAVINNTFAYSAGLDPKKESVYTESIDSPYANIIAAKSGHEHDEKLLKIVKAIQSKEVEDKAKTLFNNNLVAAW